jgi:hypothetical protein
MQWGKAFINRTWMSLALHHVQQDPEEENVIHDLDKRIVTEAPAAQ